MITLLISFFILVLCGYGLRLIKEIAALRLVELRVVAISLDAAVVPMFVLVPAIIVLLIGFVKRWRGTMTDTEVASGVKFIIISLPLFFAVWGIYGWQQSRWLASVGYEKCQFLTGSTFGASTVWVKDKGYCIQGGYRVSGELIQWVGGQARRGADVSIEDFESKVADLIK